jgi:hypothetical protein
LPTCTRIHRRPQGPRCESPTSVDRVREDPEGNGPPERALGSSGEPTMAPPLMMHYPPLPDLDCSCVDELRLDLGVPLRVIKSEPPISQWMALIR